jgi:cytochrome c
MRNPAYDELPFAKKSSGLRSFARRQRAAFALLTLLLLLVPAAHAAGNEAERGRQLFAKRCSQCHALDRNKTGPRLGGVYGRRAGSVPGFKYSKALQKAGFVWDAARLDRWLTDPESVVPHTKMDYPGSEAAERAAIIQYLKENSPQSKPQSKP